MTTNFGEATREALEFLRTKNFVGMIATVDAGGQPYLSPVYYTVGNGFEIFFVTTKNSHKSMNISSNSKVAFTVGTGPEYIAVMIRGTADIPDSTEQSKALANLGDIWDRTKATNWPVRTLDDLKDQNLTIYKITPEKVTFLNINSSEESESTTNHLYHLMD